MNETSSSPNDSTPAAGKQRREIRYDAVAAIIASLVGLLALIVAGYTAYLQRQQVRAQVWPYLQMGMNDAEGQYDLVALNKGAGPVVIRSVQVLVAGKPVGDWNELGRALAFEPTAGFVHGTLSQSVLAPGERIRWIAFENAADIKAFVKDWAQARVTAKVCYASTLGENWLTVYAPGQPDGRRPAEVSRCPDVPAAEQFRG